MGHVSGKSVEFCGRIGRAGGKRKANHHNKGGWSITGEPGSNDVRSRNRAAIAPVEPDHTGAAGMRWWVLPGVAR